MKTFLVLGTVLAFCAFAFGQQAASQEAAPDGATVFSTAGCQGCHGADGGGGIGVKLAGNQNLADANHVINQILNGGGGMPPFADQLSDAEIAAVATHERTSWGNSFGAITADQVTAQRGGGSAAAPAGAATPAAAPAEPAAAGDQAAEAAGQAGQQIEEAAGNAAGAVAAGAAGLAAAGAAAADQVAQAPEEAEAEPAAPAAGEEQAAPEAAPAAPKQPISQSPTQRELSEAATSTDSWLMYNKGYNGQRYSSLDQINTGNAAKLSPTCVLQLGEAGVSFQASPVIHQGRLYITTPHNTYALNAKTCDLIWMHAYNPAGPEPATTNRGVAISGGRIFRGTTDAHLLALDATTGDLLWDVEVADSTNGYFTSSSPIVWRNLVFTGTAGADWGSTGLMSAFDVSDGHLVWQFKEIKEDTFGGAEAASTGGGSNWTSYALDEAEGLIYVSVGNPAPDFACDYRPGDNLYTNSVVVLDATSGELQRWYQQIPHDCLDRDTAAAPILFELDDGSRRMAVASKNGLMYVYDNDRQGESAPQPAEGEQAHPPAAQQAPRSDLPPQQGQPQSSVADALIYAVPVTTRTNVTAQPTTEGVHVCPGIDGGVEWNGPTFDPNTSTIFVNSVDWCTTYTLGEVRYTPGALFFGGSFEMDPVSKGSGWTNAIDAASGQVLWQYHSERPMIAGVTPTAGGLVFTGELTGNFLALDAGTGEVLYKFNTGGPIGGGVSTYALDGKQYVAVASGNASRTWSPNAGAAATIFIFSLSE